MTRERRLPLRGLGLAVVVFGGVWAATLLYWRAHNRVPSGLDVGLWMLLLPALLLLGFWLGFRMAAKVGKRRQPASTPTAIAAGDPVASSGDPSLAWRLPVLAADALLPGGDSPDQLIHAAAAGKRVDLHSRLRDARGMPVFAADVGGIDVEMIRDSLPAASQRWNEGRLRALGLAERLALRILGDHFDSPGTAEASTTPRDPQPLLQLEWWLPAAWATHERETAGSWLGGRLVAAGWPTTLVQVVDVRAVAPGEGALQRIDELNRAWNEGAEAFPRLVLASDSAIDVESISDWGAARCLFGAGCPEGRIPGEGASALLLASAHSSALPSAFIGRLAASRRARPVDQPQRLQSDTLEDVVRQVRKGLRLPDGDMTGLVGDTDSRPSRTAEAMHLAGKGLPDADPVEALVPLGVANGDCGAALTLATLAVAVSRCAGSEGAALVFSHCDPVSRLALAVAAAPAASGLGARAGGIAAGGSQQRRGGGFEGNQG